MERNRFDVNQANQHEKGVAKIMTKTHEFILGQQDYKTEYEGHILDIEYVISSVSDDIKIVDMWRYWDSKNHNHSTPDMNEEMRIDSLSEEFKARILNKLRSIEELQR
jgi:hypothetical protein